MFSKCALNFLSKYVYWGREKSLQILISYSQAGPGRKAKQGQEEISCNHVPTFFSALYMKGDIERLENNYRDRLRNGPCLGCMKRAPRPEEARTRESRNLWTIL